MLINNQKKLEAVLDHVENGLTIKDVSTKYHIDSSRVKYFVKLYRTHGKAPFEDRDKRYVYTRELKLKAINDFITGEFSGRQIGINLGLISPDIVNDWVNLYKEKGEAAIVTTYGRKNYELKEDKIKRLNNKEAEERIKYLEAENEALKKILCLDSKERENIKEKIKVIVELRQKYKLDYLLRALKIPKRTYYYQIKNFDKKKDKDKEITKLIKEIFKKHRGKYGYLRITMDLNNKGYKINKKKVQRIMQENSLFAKQKKRKFHSFQGVVGKICDNILNREFKSTMPYQKLGTDVTQFSIKGEKIYFAPLIDFFTREILGYNISRNPNIKQQRDMMKDAYKKHGEKLNYSLIHSDQGTVYQTLAYRKLLEEIHATQSMSRRGNCIDNSPTENLFGRVKVEMFYDFEFEFENAKQLIAELKKYIKYYNEERIVLRLKKSPVSFRKEFKYLPMVLV